MHLPNTDSSGSEATGVLVVDLDALARNYHALRDRARPAECAAVVKSDAYGLGLGPVARRLFREGCRRFFVATAAEGAELRALLPEAVIYVFEGVLQETRERLIAAALVPVLSSLEQVERWSGSQRAALLQVDTGMARLGCTAAEIESLARRPELLASMSVEYLVTHLACADEPEHPLNAVQLQRFDALRRKLPPMKTSIAASAGIFLDSDHHGDLVRPGIGLYGGNPFVDCANPLEAVVTLRGRILQLREVVEAGTVGYGATFGVGPTARLAVVGVGYADGYRRALGNRAAASVDGLRVPVVGRVSMDLLCLDVSAAPPDRVRPGAWVELIGADVPLDEVAQAAGTISYELLTGLGARLRREYLGEETRRVSAFRSMTNVDGHVTPTEEARVPVLDRGFLYGDSIYEVFRTYGGVPLFYDEHWSRFQNSAALIRMNVGISKEEMTAQIAATVRATGAPQLGMDVYVRYTITRGQGPVDLYPDPSLPPRLVVIVREVPKWDPQLYARGIRAAVVGTRRNPAQALDPNIKGGNYLNNVLGIMEARALGADECIMLNDAELVTEASNSNVFFVIDGELVTPAQTAANLRGLTKAALHEACTARGLATRECDIAAHELPRATECFLTSATREVMPVMSLRLADGGGVAFPEGGGELTRRAARCYQEYVADYLSRHAHLSLW